MKLCDYLPELLLIPGRRSPSNIKVSNDDLNSQSNLDFLSENSEVMIGSVDCNAADNVNKELCQRFGVIGVPNIKILKNGDQAGSHSGGRDLEDLTEMVERYIHPENFPEEEEMDSESETEM